MNSKSRTIMFFTKVLFVVIFITIIASVTYAQHNNAFDKEEWESQIFECGFSRCFPTIQKCNDNCIKSATVPGDPSSSNFLLTLNRVDSDKLESCNNKCTNDYVLCYDSCKGPNIFNETFGCLENEIKNDGCCPGYIATQGDDGKYICVIEDETPKINKIDVKLNKKEMTLNGDDKIKVDFTFYTKNKEGKEIPASNIKIPALFVRSDNNAYVGSILGSTTFTIEPFDSYKKGHTDENGHYKGNIVAKQIAIGDEANKISEVKVYVQTGFNEETKNTFFKLKLPKIALIKIYKTDAKNPARPGAYSSYSIKLNDPSNIKKTIYLKTTSGSFKIPSKKGTTKPFVKFTTRSNDINFGWMPPEMSRRVRINQIETLKKHLSELKGDFKNHYLDTGTDLVKENLANEISSKLPIQSNHILNTYDKLNNAKEFSEDTLKNYKQMKNDYYKMFDEDSSFTENLVRTTLMTEGAYEITDGAISIATDSDDDIKSVIKKRGLELIKESLRNELIILEAAKGKEYYKFFPLSVKIVGGGSVINSKVTLTSKAPIIIYEGDDIKGGSKQ